MADLAYDEAIGWYDPSEAFCVEDGCHEPAPHSRLSSMVETDVEVDGDKAHFVYVAVCERHLQA